MILSTHKAHTLGDWASLAIQKHFEKFLKHEANVLKDKHPEDLHQMRVGMRRLRSAITGFAPAIDVPKPAQQKKIGNIARILGELRDLDVLHEALEKKYQPTLPGKEKKSLDKVLSQLDKKRTQAFAQVKTTLEGDAYQSLKQSLTKWLKQPSYHRIAQMPIQEVLPDLLSPQVSQLLLHPGWLVGTEVKDGEIHILQDLSPAMVEQQLADDGPLLHDLRKEAKRTRYQMEVFSDFYGDTYNTYLEEVKRIQSILGQIQDSFILSEFMTDSLRSEMKSHLPNLANQLTGANYQSWQEWQSIHQRYLNPETRTNFRAMILQPNAEITQ